MLQASNIILAPALHVFHVTNVSQQSTTFKTIPILSTPYHQTLNWRACKFPRYIYSNMSNTTTPKYTLPQRLVKQIITVRAWFLNLDFPSGSQIWNSPHAFRIPVQRTPAPANVLRIPVYEPPLLFRIPRCHPWYGYGYFLEPPNSQTLVDRVFKGDKLQIIVASEHILIS